MNKVICCILMMLPTLYAYPAGAPVTVCRSMLPGHGGDPQHASSSPFVIEVVTPSRTYRLFRKVTVRVKTNDAENSPFKGFLLQARYMTGSSTPTGRFYTETGDRQVRLLSCDGGETNTVTHTTTEPKTMKQFTWVSETVGGGDVYFQATFVKERLTYWTGIRSNTLTEEFPWTTTTSTTTTTTTTTTSTTITTTSPTTTSTESTSSTPDSGDDESSTSPSTSTTAADSSNNNQTTTTAPTTRGQGPSVHDGATSPSCSQATISSLWSVLGLVILWTVIMF